MNRELKVNITGDNSNFKKATAETAKSIGTLKDEYRRLSRQSLVGATPQEVEELNKRLAVLRDRIGDTNKTIQSLSLDPFQKMAEMTQVASTMMAGLAGAATMAGGSQEELNKLMQKTVALMAIARAAQEAATFFQERAYGIMIKNKYREISATLTSILTIKTQTAATIEGAAAQGTATTATTILTKATALWNKTIAANPIILIIAGIAALTVGIYALVKAFSSNNKEAKSYEKTIDGVIIKDEEMRKSHNEHVVTMKKLQNEWDLLTGKISEYHKTLSDVSTDHQVRMKEISDTASKELEKVNGFWATAQRKIIKAWNGMYDETAAIQQQTNKILAKTNQEAQQELEQHAIKIALITEKQRQTEIKAAKEYAVLTAKTEKEKLDAQIALSHEAAMQEMKAFEKGSNQYELAVQKHVERVEKLRKEYTDKSIKAAKESETKIAAATKEAQELMFAESAAYWQKKINLSNQMGKIDVDSKLALLEVETKQRLSKVKTGSEQEALILQESQTKRNEILREGFDYQYKLGNEMVSSMQQQLTTLADMNTAYGSSFDYIGEQMALYKAEIDKAIAAGDLELLKTQELIAAYNELAAAKLAATTESETQQKAQEAQIAYTDALQSSIVDLSATFGASMITMQRDGAAAAGAMIKQSMAQVVAILIQKIMASMPFPANVALAAGAGGIGSLLFNQIPAFAEGAIVSAPMLAMVGDNPSAHVDPEVIAPLSKLKDMIGGDGGDMGKVEFMIKGSDLYALFDKYATYKSKYR